MALKYSSIDSLDTDRPNSERHGYANPFRSMAHIETQICFDVGF